jgi:hypothetical protein
MGTESPSLIALQIEKKEKVEIGRRLDRASRRQAPISSIPQLQKLSGQLKEQVKIEKKKKKK